jgi:hypothetical protein
LKKGILGFIMLFISFATGCGEIEQAVITTQQDTSEVKDGAKARRKDSAAEMETRINDFKGEEAYIVFQKEEMVNSLIYGWENEDKKISFIYKGEPLTENDIFSILDTAELNSSRIPCEGKNILYEEDKKREEGQFLNMWIEYYADEELFTARKTELEEKIEQYGAELARQGIQDSKGLYEVIYSFVIEKTQYDETLNALTGTERLTKDMHFDRTAYGAFVGGQTVCTGYARGFKALCDYLELPCYITAGTKDGREHAWNVVKIGKEHLYIDCTLADTGYTKEDTFLIDKAQLEHLGYEINEYFLQPDE